MKRNLLTAIGFAFPYLVAWVGGLEVFERGGWQATTLIAATYLAAWFYFAPWSWEADK